MQSWKASLMTKFSVGGVVLSLFFPIVLVAIPIARLTDQSGVIIIRIRRLVIATWDWKENGIFNAWRIWRSPPPQDSTLLQDHQPCTWFISHYWGFRGVNGIVVLVFKRSCNLRFIHWLIVSSKSELLKYLPCRLILGSFVRLFCLLHPQFLFNCDAWGKPKHGKK